MRNFSAGCLEALLPVIPSQSSSGFAFFSVGCNDSGISWLLFWQSRRFHFVVCCIFTFHREAKVPKVAPVLHGMTMKHKLFSITSRVTDQGGGGARHRVASEETSLIFGSRSLKFLILTWSSNTLPVCSWRGSSPATACHLKSIIGWSRIKAKARDRGGKYPRKGCDKEAESGKKKKS